MNLSPDYLKENGAMCEKCQDKGYIFIGDHVIECECTLESDISQINSIQRETVKMEYEVKIVPQTQTISRPPSHSLSTHTHTQ